MPDSAKRLSDLRRPRLLVRAARFGSATYRRDRDLRRLTGLARAPGIGKAVDLLMEKEAEANHARTSGSAAYSVASHVSLLAAIIAEAKLTSEV